MAADDLGAAGFLVFLAVAGLASGSAITERVILLVSFAVLALGAGVLVAVAVLLALTVFTLGGAVWAAVLFLTSLADDTFLVDAVDFFTVSLMIVSLWLANEFIVTKVNGINMTISV